MRSAASRRYAPLRSLSPVFDGQWRDFELYGGQPTHRQTHWRGGFVEVSLSMKPTP